MAKRVHFSREPKWMRHVTQGHVAGATRTRASACVARCDVCIFIFTCIIMLIVHISIRYFRFKLTVTDETRPQGHRFHAVSRQK